MHFVFVLITKLYPHPLFHSWKTDFKNLHRPLKWDSSVACCKDFVHNLLGGFVPFSSISLLQFIMLLLLYGVGCGEAGNMGVSGMEQLLLDQSTCNLVLPSSGLIHGQMLHCSLIEVHFVGFSNSQYRDSWFSTVSAPFFRVTFV